MGWYPVCVYPAENITDNRYGDPGNIYVKDLDTPIADLWVNALLNGQKSRGNGLQVVFNYAYNNTRDELHKKYIERGVILISNVLLKDENGKPYPMIVLESRNEVQNAFCAIGKYIKSYK